MTMQNVYLTEHLRNFIEQGVLSGRFADANQAVTEALSLLEQREADEKNKLAWLRAATREGLDQIERGEASEFDSIENLAAHIHQMGEQIEAAEPRP